MKIAIVDDHFAIRDGYKLVLENLESVASVLTYSNSNDLISYMSKSPFDLIILDIELKGENGIEICKKLKLINKNIKVLILTTYHSNEYIKYAYENDADGYVFKDSGSQIIMQAVTEIVLQDKKYFENEALKVIFELIESKKTGSKRKFHLLSEKELVIINFICEGKSNKEIGALLNRKEATIACHKQNIMKKLELHKTVDIYRFATENGIFKPKIGKGFNNHK